MIKNKRFNELYEAYEFISGDPSQESSATLDKTTGKIYYDSEYLDENDAERLPAEEYNADIHIELPYKDELDLGSELVFDFVEQFMPNDEDKVSQIFSKKGAYSRYKDFLDSKGFLQKWYDFETRKKYLALLLWCKENDIDFIKG